MTALANYLPNPRFLYQYEFQMVYIFHTYSFILQR